jgi:cellulose synthase/poly-beta-1,6-N-acetylglucosamine synthase-like glycosyltransferase
MIVEPDQVAQSAAGTQPVGQTPSVSVVVCAYTEERWPDLVAAIESLRAQTVAPLDIVVAVDHNPRLLDRLTSGYSDVVAVASTGERGLSGARNSGLAAAKGDVIAFLDDDAIAEPDWLERLLAGYADARTIGVGGAIEPIWLSGRPRWFPEEFLWVVGCTYLGTPKSTQAVRNLIGCNMSFRRGAFADDQRFRDGIGRVGTRPTGCEETDLCIRIQQRQPDSVILFEPSARVRHRVPAWRATWGYFVARCHAEGISKALVSRAVGAGSGLATERTYTLRVLPKGVARGLADTTFRRDVAGLPRAGAIVLGLAATALGFLTEASRRVISR